MASPAQDQVMSDEQYARELDTFMNANSRRRSARVAECQQASGSNAKLSPHQQHAGGARAASPLTPESMGNPVLRCDHDSESELSELDDALDDIPPPALSTRGRRRAAAAASEPLKKIGPVRKLQNGLVVSQNLVLFLLASQARQSMYSRLIF